MAARAIYGDDGEDVILADNAGFVVPFAAYDTAQPALPKKGSLSLQKVANDFLGLFNQKDYNKKTQTLYSDLVEGGAGDDIVLGDFGKDVINGGSGNDKLFGGKTKDSISGGGGSDTIKQGGSSSSKTLIQEALSLFITSASPQL